jgi:hypothetical protein
MASSDVNLNITDLLGAEREDEGEISSCNLTQQENLKSFCTSACESTLAASSQCLRGSGSNSEIAQIQGKKDSTTSEDNCASRYTIIAEQAQLISQLISQVETQTHEIRQRDIEFSRSQKDELNMCSRTEVAAVLLKPRSKMASPRRRSSASSGPECTSMTETERLLDVEEAKELLSSVTSYSIQHLSSNVDEQWSNETQTLMPPVGEESVSPKKRDLLEALSSSHQEKHTDVARRSVSSPVKTTNAVGEVGVQGVAVVSGRGILKKQDHSNSMKSSYRIHHSSIASAVALSQLQQSIHHHENDGGSLFESDSEAWSEPDRNVSETRIGLNKECTKAVLSSRRGINGCTLISSARPHNGRIIHEETDTSESSEETAHEISRIQGMGTHFY